MTFNKMQAHLLTLLLCMIIQIEHFRYFLFFRTDLQQDLIQKYKEIEYEQAYGYHIYAMHAHYLSRSFYVSNRKFEAFATFSLFASRQNTPSSSCFSSLCSVLNKFSSFGELNCQRIDYIQCCCAYSAHAQSTRQLLGSLNQKWLLALIEVTCCAPFGKEKAVRLKRHLTICSLTKDLVQQ